ncbi:MAG TPA: TonB family protein [Acidobacteriaceae bacterium]|nr:TonB family protein [Acidobacteriaceae bacterium]
MNKIVHRVLVLGLAMGVVAIPCGRAQEKPEKPPPLPGQGGSADTAPSQKTEKAPSQKPEKAPPLPGQKGQDAKSAEQEQSGVTVAIVNRIPPEDKHNLNGYWAGVENKIGQRWQHAAAAQKLTDAVKITGWIHTDGRVTGLMVEHGSGNASVDRAARATISESAPYDPFPYGIAVDEVKVRFTFGAAAGAPDGPPPAVVH